MKASTPQLLLTLCAPMVLCSSAAATPPLYAPFPCGESYIVSQANGGMTSHLDAYNRHAWDFDLDLGDAVVAPADGVVRAMREDSTQGGCSESNKNKENYVVLQFDDGSEALFAHLKTNSVPVRQGQRVRRGEKVGEVGLTGWVCDDHLHFQIQNNCAYHWCTTIAASFVDIGNPVYLQRVTSQNCAPPAEPNARVDSIDVPAQITLQSGMARVSISLQNNGDLAWSPAENFRLASRPNNQLLWANSTAGGYCNGPQDCRLELPSQVAPGGRVRLSFDLSLPSNTTAGSRTFAFQMIQDGVGYFGDAQSYSVPIVDAQNPPVDMGTKPPVDMGRSQPDMPNPVLSVDMGQGNDPPKDDNPDDPERPGESGDDPDEPAGANFGGATCSSITPSHTQPPPTLLGALLLLAALLGRRRHRR